MQFEGDFLKLRNHLWSFVPFVSTVAKSSWINNFVPSYPTAKLVGDFLPFTYGYISRLAEGDD